MVVAQLAITNFHPVLMVILRSGVEGSVVFGLVYKMPGEEDFRYFWTGEPAGVMSDLVARGQIQAVTSDDYDTDEKVNELFAYILRGGGAVTSGSSAAAPQLGPEPAWLPPLHAWGLEYIQAWRRSQLGGGGRQDGDDFILAYPASALGGR